MSHGRTPNIRNVVFEKVRMQQARYQDMLFITTKKILWSIGSLIRYAWLDAGIEDQPPVSATFQ